MRVIVWITFALTLARADVACAILLTGGESPLIEAHSNSEALNDLLDIAERRLASARLFVDRSHAALALAGTATIEGQFEVRSDWQPTHAGLQLPLVFSLVSPTSGPPDRLPIRASLSAPLLREVFVTIRKIAKGDPLDCTSLTVERRDVRRLQNGTSLSGCAMSMTAVARRHLGRGEVIRESDFGQAPDVSAEAPVRAVVMSGSVAIEAKAIALADAHLGDVVSVRLGNPRRTVTGRVTAPGQVSLDELNQ